MQSLCSGDVASPPSTLRSPKPVRRADSGSIPPLTAPITVRTQRLASAGCSPPAEPDTARRPPLPFPHRLAAPLFGALLSGVLTYCLHQCAATTPVQGRLIRARATYAAAAGVPAELPVSAEPVFLAGPAVGPQASRAESVDASSRLPVVRPIDLRFAREARPRRPLGARPKTGKLRPSGTASRHAVTRR